MLRLLASFALFLTLGAARADVEPLLVSLPASFESGRAARMSNDLLELLESEVGRPFALADHGNALTYLSDLKAGRYALVVEGPHVIGALAEQGSVVPVAEFQFDLSYVVVVPKEDERVFQLDDLAGKPVCTGAMPDLFGLHLVDAIDNPTREPVMVQVADHQRRVRHLLSGRCRAATMQTTRFLTLGEDEGADALRIIYKSRDMPGIGAAVSASLEPELRQRISEALLSRQGVRATRALSIGLFGSEAPLLPSDPDRLKSLAALMQGFFSW